MRASKRLVLADPLSEGGLAILRESGALQVEDLSRQSRAEVLRAMPGSAGLIVRSRTRVDRELLEASEALEVVGRAGVGLDNIDVDAATRLGVAVLNAPAGNTLSTAELTFGLLLATARHVLEADRSVREGRWDRSGLSGAQLSGRTLGVIGAGRIGTEVIRRARAFGMTVLAHDPYLEAERASELGARTVSLDDLLAEADFVTLHVPLTEETRRILDARRIGQMRPGAVLVNCARGGLVDEEALAAALRSGRLAGAALDVFDTEPLPPEHPLRQAPNLVLTPHIGASTPEAQGKVAIEIALAVRDALLAGDLSGAVNVTPLDASERRRIEPTLDLARRLGTVAACLAPGRARRIEVRVASASDSGPELVAAAVLTGFLRASHPGRLNIVNAPIVAEEQGIHVERTRLKPMAGHAAWIEVVVDGGRTREIAGAVRSDLSFGIVRVDGHPVNVAPRGTLLFVRNRDVPGVIGRLGTRLGDAGVNIGELHQSRVARGGEALAVIGLDEGLSADLRRELAGLPDILEVVEARLEA